MQTKARENTIEINKVGTIQKIAFKEFAEFLSNPKNLEEEFIQTVRNVSKKSYLTIGW